MTAKEVWEKMLDACRYHEIVACAHTGKLCAFDACPLLKSVPVGREEEKR